MMQDFAYGADVSVVKQLSLGEAGTVVGLDLLPGTVLQHFFPREFQYGGSGSQIAEALPLAVEYDGGQGQTARAMANTIWRRFTPRSVGRFPKEVCWCSSPLSKAWSLPVASFLFFRLWLPGTF